MKKFSLDLFSQFVRRSDYCSVYEDGIAKATISINVDKAKALASELKKHTEDFKNYEVSYLIASVKEDIISFEFEDEPEYHYIGGDFCRITSDGTVCIASSSKYDTEDRLSIEIHIDELLELPSVS